MSMMSKKVRKRNNGY